MAKEKKPEKVKNEFKIRLYDTQLIKSIEELMQTKRFESYNDLLSYAVGIGIEKIYLDYGKRRAFQSPPDAVIPSDERLNRLEHILAELKVMLEDIFIVSNSQEILTATIYNVLRSEAEGETVSAELMDSGFFSNLPEFFLEIKDKLIERSKKKARKRSET